MVDRTLRFLASCILLFPNKNLIYAYYCDNDKCDFDEYCCGHNICCTSYNVWQMWYFWLGLVIFLILLAGCFSFWRYRYQQALVVQSCSHSGYNQLLPSSQHSIPSHLLHTAEVAGRSQTFNAPNFTGKNGINTAAQSVAVYT